MFYIILRHPTRLFTTTRNLPHHLFRVMRPILGSSLGSHLLSPFFFDPVTSAFWASLFCHDVTTVDFRKCTRLLFSSPIISLLLGQGFSLFG